MLYGIEGFAVCEEGRLTGREFDDVEKTLCDRLAAFITSTMVGMC